MESSPGLEKIAKNDNNGNNGGGSWNSARKTIERTVKWKNK